MVVPAFHLLKPITPSEAADVFLRLSRASSVVSPPPRHLPFLLGAAVLRAMAGKEEKKEAHSQNVQPRPTSGGMSSTGSWPSTSRPVGMM